LLSLQITFEEECTRLIWAFSPCPPAASSRQHQEWLVSGTCRFCTLATMVLVATDLLATIKQQVLPWELAAITCCSKMVKTQVESCGAETMGYRTAD